MLEVDKDPDDMIRPERATDTRVRPSRAEPEVLDDELASPGERSERVSRPFGPSKAYSLSTLTQGSARRSV